MSGGSGGGDRAILEQALGLAALGEGATSPNPRVGCVVVKEGRVVGVGYHRAPGQRHAEARALADAGRDAHGATLYVNLEPCAHHGRTPPCADHIVRAGVQRVVASAVDPNPLVNGRGFARLRAAGIDVRVGLLEEAARSLNAPFFHWHRTGRPLVTLKAAASADGMLSAAGGASQWITGATARRFAHRLRFAHDAVLVGAGTVRRDAPRLTVRLPGVRATRLKVVLAPDLALDPGARLFADATAEGAPVRVYAAASAPAERERRLEAARVVRVPHEGSRLSLSHVLEDLGREGVQSVLVEGGGVTLGRFVEAGLADRFALFSAPALIGHGGGTPMIGVDAVPEPARGWRLRVEKRFALGVDRLTYGSLADGAAEPS